MASVFAVGFVTYRRLRRRSRNMKFAPAPADSARGVTEATLSLAVSTTEISPVAESRTNTDVLSELATAHTGDVMLVIGVPVELSTVLMGVTDAVKAGTTVASPWFTA